MASGSRGCVGRIAVVVLLVAAAYAGWRWGSLVFPRIRQWFPISAVETPSVAEPTPELADSVLSRVQAFRRGEDGDRLALGGRDITSVVKYSVPGLIPEGVRDPVIRLDDGRVLFRGRVALNQFPDLPDLGPVVGILPDTLDVELRASLMPFGKNEAALVVQQVEASHVPLPRRMIPQILEGMGRVDRPGLPPEAMVVPLPAGLDSAYILGDSLVLARGS